MVTQTVLGQGKVIPKLQRDTVFPHVDSLKAAIVTAMLRPRMKGDTLEYNTEHVRLRPNADVEELLRRLPGLQIDANGNITYNGQPIQHLLVDGEDVFGNNPTLVTRTFDGSKIAWVQILDRKSEQAIFTGVDDGSRTKTLNLVLKESAKDGYFGKVEAGGNTGGYYSANAALAAFKDKQQFTALGLASNTGVLGFTSSNGGANSGVSFQNGITDPLDATAGTGIPHFAGAALHYANTWNGSQDHVVGNYQYSHYLSRPVTTIQSVQTLPNARYQQNQQNQSVNQQDQHWFYGTYDWKSVSMGDIKVNVRGNSATGSNQFFSTSTAGFNDTLANGSHRTIRDQVSQQNFGMDLFWHRSLGKPERVLSSVITLNKTSNTTAGFLYSLNQFYSAGVVQSDDTVDQRKRITSRPLTVGGNLYYTEPIWKGAVLAGGLGLTVSSDAPLQATYNRGNGKYTAIVDSLSSQYQSQTISRWGVLNLQGKTRNLTYMVGAGPQFFTYSQKDLIADTVVRQHYFYWSPHVTVSYTPNPATHFRFFYSISTQQPSLAQLQPIKNNSDPLHITLGNPGLRPTANQYLNFGYQRLKSWILNLDFGFVLTSNAISTRTTTDSLGRQISQPVNVDGGGSATINFSVNRKIGGFDFGFHSAGSFGRTVNFVDAYLSRNNTVNGGGGFSLSRYVADKYNLQLSTNFNYFYQQSSINTSIPLHYWSQNHIGSLTLYFLHNFAVNTNATYTWQQKSSAFASSTSVLLWNGYFARDLLENRLTIKAQMNNILDKNAGISRTNSGNTNTETYSNILGRYWMLTAIYHFDRKFGKK